MRRLALVALAVLLVPVALAHGSHGLHLMDVDLSYAPLEAGQRLRFSVGNDWEGDAVNVRAHITVRDALFRESYALDPIPAGAIADVVLIVPLRLAPSACLTVTADHKASDEMCALGDDVALT